MTNKFLKMVVQGLVMLNSIQESNLDSNKLAKTKAWLQWKTMEQYFHLSLSVNFYYQANIDEGLHTPKSNCLFYYTYKLSKYGT